MIKRLWPKIFCAHHGVEGAEARVVAVDLVYGNACGHKGVLHVGGFVVAFHAIVAADDDGAAFTRVVELGGGGDAFAEKAIAAAVGQRLGAAKHQGDLDAGGRWRRLRQRCARRRCSNARAAENDEPNGQNKAPCEELEEASHGAC